MMFFLSFSFFNEWYSWYITAYSEWTSAYSRFGICKFADFLGRTCPSLLAEKLLDSLFSWSSLCHKGLTLFPSGENLFLLLSAIPHASVLFRLLCWQILLMRLCCLWHLYENRKLKHKMCALPQERFQTTMADSPL